MASLHWQGLILTQTIKRQVSEDIYLEQSINYPSRLDQNITSKDSDSLFRAKGNSWKDEYLCVPSDGVTSSFQSFLV